MLKKRTFLALTILCLFVLSSIQIQAGTENKPEIIDIQGDSTSGKDSRDILWGYMGHEQNNSVNVVLGIAALETYTNPNDIMDFPVTQYKYYFSVFDVNYAAVATVPVHGPFGIDIRYELRTVEYNGSEPSQETQKATLSNANYDSVNGIINMTIPKSEIGGPEKTDISKRMWCGVYSQQREGQFNLSEPELEDRAPDTGYGKNYIFRGEVGKEIVRLEIETDGPFTGNVTPTIRFEVPIKVINNGTQTQVIDMNYSKYEGQGWAIQVTPDRLTLEDQASENVTLLVAIENARKIENNEEINIQVYAQTNLGNETEQNIEKSNALVFTIKASIPPPPPEEKTPFEEFNENIGKFFEEHGTNLGIGITLIIVLVVVVILLRMRKGKEEEFEDLDVEVEGERVPLEETRTLDEEGDDPRDKTPLTQG